MNGPIISTPPPAFASPPQLAAACSVPGPRPENPAQQRKIGSPSPRETTARHKRGEKDLWHWEGSRTRSSCKNRLLSCFVVAFLQSEPVGDVEIILFCNCDKESGERWSRKLGGHVSSFVSSDLWLQERLESLNKCTALVSQLQILSM